MTPLADWTPEQIEREFTRYTERLVWLDVDYRERVKSIREGMWLLEDELARRKEAAESAFPKLPEVDTTGNHPALLYDL